MFDKTMNKLYGSICLEDLEDWIGKQEWKLARNGKHYTNINGFFFHELDDNAFDCTIKSSSKKGGDMVKLRTWDLHKAYYEQLKKFREENADMW